ncbi:hypothetical protein SAY86_018353 [Trapa natans]|uniref:Acid phosphatase n=1 Tax=Trapa natans TaxID=22666 RepID=A0AAN7LMU7_TRANT|nr:hypothetical protein SAY86_018353 [Trapa natans]
MWGFGRCTEEGMSAYAQQMEREFSGRILPDRENSEVASSIDSMESGFYMTAFATTVFIASFISIGILLVSLLIALTVMLQSCESKNAGIIEVKRSSNGDHDVCRIFELHAELNPHEEINYPSACRDLGLLYVREGQYEKDLNISIVIVEDHFTDIQPLGDDLDLILLDVDSMLFPSSSRRTEQDDSAGYMNEANSLRERLILKLYLKLQASGWSMVLVTRGLERERNAITNRLVSAGFRNWYSLIMRFNDEEQMSSQEYFHRRIEYLRNTGFRVRGTISNQMDALTSSWSGGPVFKIPNPVYERLSYLSGKAGTQ